jgi:phosphoribosyl 1,2-cyclic phosphodiesterase
MKGFCPLASGSKGNCLYFSAGGSKILIDAGLSGRQTRLRLAEIGVELEEIDAIMISHEHTDHIAGLKMLALRMGIPVLANAETAKGIYHTLKECPKFQIFQTGERFEFGDLSIHPFTIPHDAADPVAFTIEAGGLKMGICTDLGFATTLVQAQLAGCDYLHLEANHEPSMVHACSRPMVYKQRVLSRSGHLSNEAAGHLIAQIRPKHVHLAHLSEECNSPEVALKVVGAIAGDIPLSIAHQRTVSWPVHFDADVDQRQSDDERIGNDQGRVDHAHDERKAQV